MPPRRRTTAPAVPFQYKLVLNQYLLSLFGVQKFERLAEFVGNAREGLDTNNIHHFHHALVSQLLNFTHLSEQQLLEYDQNIVTHTLSLNDRRLTHGDEPIEWKYFQYLSLLFTEVYLDRYFGDPHGLLAGINDQIDKYNEGKDESNHVTKLTTDGDAWQQLNKISYWMATGSGKTLVMHANILQYRFYLEKHGKTRDLNRIILLTPNEGLTEQHRKEFEASGIYAERFTKDGQKLFTGKTVEIIEVTKLKEEMGDKTVAVDAFEGNNLVLVDEGHRGASGGGEGAWMKYRNKLCENGYSFEYSATFGQAVKGDTALAQQYAKNILFDYSYRYFYGDGFGKDYQILNIENDEDSEWVENYLTACLLSFYQQQKLYEDAERNLRPFNIEKPLWVFVGGSVTKSLGSQEATDIVRIIKFVAGFVGNRNASISRIAAVLERGLINHRGTDLFAGRFDYLILQKLSAEQIFSDILFRIFNNSAGGHLTVENLKGATGEIALRLGEGSEPFGVINVSDDKKLVDLCETNGLDTAEREFSGSLFHEINEEHSTVNILIGAKKFTEGWSSWRVSTMGLMNVGRGEGAQIIQLFGRGVRLKGYDHSLKRSNFITLPDGVERPRYINVLETLSIFGIRADYMARFREFLKEEGLPDNEEKEEILLPVIKNLNGTQNLRTIRLKNEINGKATEGGHAFRRIGPIPTIAKPDPQNDPSTDYLIKNKVVLNWYPKIQAIKAKGLSGGDGVALQNEGRLTNDHVAFLDLERLVFDLGQFKAERGWYNLNLTRSGVADLLADHSWYRLLIPSDELEFTSFEKVRVWQEIALALLKNYTKRYYTFRKREWELPHLEYQAVSPFDPNMLGRGENPDDPYYRILIEQSQVALIQRLTELKAAIEAGDLYQLNFQGLQAIWFDRHLYQP
ncbi:MAG: DEAD/DEAH box helicase family protein, partial [Acidobacteria bacterium]|nr:DEAD/DEAH box helicase family protein [Acidobacteriota bacterium]